MRSHKTVPVSSSKTPDVHNVTTDVRSEPKRGVSLGWLEFLCISTPNAKSIIANKTMMNAAERNPEHPLHYDMQLWVPREHSGHANNLYPPQHPDSLDASRISYPTVVQEKNNHRKQLRFEDSHQQAHC